MPSLFRKLSEWARRLRREAVALWFAARDPRTPWIAKAIGVFVVAYALSPIDLIPDFIPVLGLLDDALLLPALIWIALRFVPAAVLADSRRQADAATANGTRFRSRIGAGLVIAAWLLSAVVLAVVVARWSDR